MASFLLVWSVETDFLQLLSDGKRSNKEASDAQIDLCLVCEGAGYEQHRCIPSVLTTIEVRCESVVFRECDMLSSLSVWSLTDNFESSGSLGISLISENVDIERRTLCLRQIGADEGTEILSDKTGFLMSAHFCLHQDKLGKCWVANWSFTGRNSTEIMDSVWMLYFGAGVEGLWCFNLMIANAFVVQLWLGEVLNMQMSWSFQHYWLIPKIVWD